MKFICEQQNLSKALNIVSKALLGRTTIPILKGILISAKNDSLTLTASDIDITIEKVINAEVIEEGEIVVTAKLLIDLVRKLPNEEITFELKENNNIGIKCGKSKFNLLSFPAYEYPIEKSVENNLIIRLKTEDFTSMVKRTAFATSLDETKGTITGVLFEIEKDKISMVATDGFRMALSHRESQNEEEAKIIILGKFLSEINKITSESEEDEIKISIEKNKAVFEIENTRIFVRLLEGTFIDYKKIIPQELPINVTVNKLDLIESIDRASLFSREGKNNLIKFSMKEDVMEISSRSEEGNIIESVDIQKTGDDIEIGFNSKYLIEGLKIYDSENIKIELNTSVTPCLLTEESEKTIYLILPVRLTGNN